MKEKIKSKVYPRNEHERHLKETGGMRIFVPDYKTSKILDFTEQAKRNERE
jgi:hypothetical protein